MLPPLPPNKRPKTSAEKPVRRAPERAVIAQAATAVCEWLKSSQKFLSAADALALAVRPSVPPLLFCFLVKSRLKRRRLAPLTEKEETMQARNDIVAVMPSAFVQQHAVRVRDSLRSLWG